MPCACKTKPRVNAAVSAACSRLSPQVLLLNAELLSDPRQRLLGLTRVDLSGSPTRKPQAGLPEIRKQPTSEVVIARRNVNAARRHTIGCAVQILLRQ
jgi:hypothetical protein